MRCWTCGEFGHLSSVHKNNKQNKPELQEQTQVKSAAVNMVDETDTSVNLGRRLALALFVLENGSTTTTTVQCVKRRCTRGWLISVIRPEIRGRCITTVSYTHLTLPTNREV